MGLKRCFILFLILSLLTTSCDKKADIKNTIEIVKDSIQPLTEDTKIDSIANNEQNEPINKLLIPVEKIIEDYKIRAFYLDYNDDKYESENPAIIEVYKGNELIFTDSIKADDRITIQSLGFKQLSGKKLFFTLNYGTYACDYVQSYLYYFITIDDKVHFFKKFYTQSTGYAGKSLNTIFPDDSAGVADKLIKIEKITYFGGEEPNKVDTTIYAFDNNTFTETRIKRKE